MSVFYRDYASYLTDTFGPGKVQKITVNLGLGCPNRDGTTGTGGCIYCNNSSFSPAFANARLSVSQQLADGKAFFARKYPKMQYLAYFQAYTSTHGNIDTLIDIFSQALDVPDVIGLVIGTRPDCMPQRLLDALATLSRARARTIIIEYGAESSHNTTLTAINRCHTWQQTVDAVHRTSNAGLHIGLHFILGLPGEDIPMMLKTVDRVNALPVNTVKFHQLQVIANTPLARQYIHGGLAECRMHEFSVKSYTELCAIIVRRLRSDIAIERFLSQAPPDLLLYPRWGLKNYQFTHLIERELAKNADR